MIPDMTDSRVTCTSVTHLLFYLHIHVFIPSFFNSSGPQREQLITMFAMQCHFFEEFFLQIRQITSRKICWIKLPWKHQIIQLTLTSSYRLSLGSGCRIKWLVETDICACFVFHIICRRVCYLLLCGNKIFFSLLIIEITCCNKSNMFCTAQKILLLCWMGI